MDEFNKDLELGQSFENVVADYFMRVYKVVTTQDKGRFDKFDLRIQPCAAFTMFYEAKYDRLTHKTGRVLFEYYKRTDEFGVQKCGVSTTKASYYILGFRNIDTVYKISTKVVRQLINERKYISKDWVGNGGKSHCYIFDFEFIISHAKPLFKTEATKNI